MSRSSRATRVLAGQDRRQDRTGARCEILLEQLALLAEGLAISAKKEIDQYPEAGRQDEREHPRQGRLRRAVLGNQEPTYPEGVDGQQGRHDRADVDIGHGANYIVNHVGNTSSTRFVSASVRVLGSKASGHVRDLYGFSLGRRVPRPERCSPVSLYSNSSRLD